MPDFASLGGEFERLVSLSVSSIGGWFGKLGNISRVSDEDNTCLCLLSDLSGLRRFCLLIALETLWNFGSNRCDSLVCAGSGVGRERGEGQQEDPHRAAPHPARRPQRRGALPPARHGHNRQRWCHAQHPQPSAPQEGRRQQGRGCRRR
uniref:Uncharacterized protein n=1 Tax=Triticum urartu TaxID=4572 RepID=A0A8R7TGC5_TRIUA